MTREELEQRRRELVAEAPQLAETIRGSLFVRTRRCGRATCHCATGDGHATTYLSVALGAGKNVQVTVPEELVPVVQRWADNYSHLWRVLEEVSALNREMLRQRLVKPAATSKSRSQGRSR